MISKRVRRAVEAAMMAHWRIAVINGSRVGIWTPSGGKVVDIEIDPIIEAVLAASKQGKSRGRA